MKRLLYYLPIHFLVFLILGISSQYFYRLWNFNYYFLGCFIAFTFLLFYLITNKVAKTFFTFLIFFTLGLSSVYINDATNYENYYINFTNRNNSKILKIDKVLKSGNYYHKFEAEVVQVDTIETRGKVLLNVKKDSNLVDLDVDDFLLVKSNFKEVIPPLNPHQFNYKSFLKKQGIYQQLFIDKEAFVEIKKETFSLKGLSARFRNKVQKSLKKYRFKDDVFGVINALLLGQRQDISKELINNYSKAGAIHILAVSGLHVGIILLILTWLFKPLDFLKNGKLIKTILIVFILWVFAFIAGLSASVVRAVTMFSFVAFGLLFKRKNVVEFSLISSMFFLLIVKPMFLFDVGFQLSYLAVFGIIWIQPKLYKLWQPKLKIIDFFWRLFTVSIAAQVGILPISIYYFHQFPGLFLLSNLVIIPFLGIILMLGILVIILSLLNVLPDFLFQLYSIVISLQNSFVVWISNQEVFLFQELSLSFLVMLSLYFIFFSFGFVCFNYSPKKLVVFLYSIIVFQFVFLFQEYEIKMKKEFIVFHKSKYSILGKRIGKTIYINQNTKENLNKISLLKSYKVGEKVYLKSWDKSNYLKIGNQQFLIVDSLGIYKLKKLKNPIIILQNSPKINLGRLIKNLNPKEIIADGSNYKSYINTWEKISNKEKTPFHYTGQKGAYIFEY